MQSFPSSRSWLSPRTHPTVVFSRCQIIGRRGRVASSAAPSRTLSHTQRQQKVTSRASVRSCRPSHLTDTLHLSDWAYIRLILRFLPPSTQSHDLVCMPSAVVATRARITRTCLVNAMQRMISHDIPPRCPFFMQNSFVDEPPMIAIPLIAYPDVSFIRRGKLARRNLIAPS